MRAILKKPVKYAVSAVGKVKVVKDFLSRPNNLALCESNVKVTLLLSSCSVEFFNRETGKRRVPYQRMIRPLLDAYAKREGERA